MEEHMQKFPIFVLLYPLVPDDKLSLVQGTRPKLFFPLVLCSSKVMQNIPQVLISLINYIQNTQGLYIFYSQPLLSALLLHG